MKSLPTVIGRKDWNSFDCRLELIVNVNPALSCPRVLPQIHHVFEVELGQSSLQTPKLIHRGIVFLMNLTSLERISSRRNLVV